MMKAEVGDSSVVAGRRSVIVKAGPMPGRTPMAVPSVQRKKPTKIHGLQRDAKALHQIVECRHGPTLSCKREEGAELDAEIGEAVPSESRQNRADRQVHRHLFEPSAQLSA